MQDKIYIPLALNPNNLNENLFVRGKLSSIKEEIGEIKR
jgi:hypothetical protein